jgi:hypothetical protein
VNDARKTYLLAADVAVSLISHERTAADWRDESVLPGMSIGVLAAHLARSILQVGWFLDGDVTGEPAPVPASTYYARLTDTESRVSVLNSGVEQRSAQTAARGPAAIGAEAQEALDALRERLPVEAAERRVAVAHRPGEELLLDEYLRTRLVELAVHTEDLALSLGLEQRAPTQAITAAVNLLLDAARERHGDTAVLQALTRRERDDVNALRVL